MVGGKGPDYNTRRGCWLCPTCIHSLKEALVGRAISVYWSLDEVFYQGVINCYDDESKTYRVLYTDNDWEFIDVTQEIVYYKLDEL